MPMPAGIENLALGLIQGMNVRKADERQKLQDQRQAEQDQMRRQEFDLQQQARQFDLGNAKTTAANAATDRSRTLALQARGDAFSKHFNSAYALAQSGDEDGAVGALATGFNDPAFGLPYKAVPQVGSDGKLVRDKDGKFMIGYADASGKLVETKPWTLGEAMTGFRGINDAAGQFDKLRESQANTKEKESEQAHDMAKIDRTGAWDVQRASVTADAALDRAELGLGGGGTKSQYSLDGEIKSIFGSEADVSPIARRVIVQQIEGGIGAAAGSKDVRDRAQGWNQAYQGFLGAVRSADAGRKLSPRQIEEQAKFLFDKHLRETYGVGYDDAMTQLGLVDPKTLPKKGRAQQPAPAGNSPKTPAQTLVDPVKQSRDAQNAYKQANNFISGGGF